MLLGGLAPKVKPANRVIEKAGLRGIERAKEYRKIRRFRTANANLERMKGNIKESVMPEIQPYPYIG